MNILQSFSELIDIILHLDTYRLNCFKRALLSDKLERRRFTGDKQRFKSENINMKCIVRVVLFCESNENRVQNIVTNSDFNRVLI